MRIPSVATLALAGGALLLPTGAAAQVDDVKAAIRDELAAWNSGDVTTFGSFFAEQARGFNLDGGQVIVGFNARLIEAALAAGFAIHLEPRDIDVKIYGHMAVTVAYMDGSITLPGGEPQEGTWRYSETRIEQDGVWKVVQYHFSPLTTAPIRRRR